MSDQAPTPNEEDDLFNFDDLFRAPSKSEAASASSVAQATPASTVAAPPVRATAPVIKPALPSPAPAVVANTPGQLPLVRPVSPRPQAASVPMPATAPIQAAQEPRRVSALTFALLCAATLINLALVGVVWRSMSGVGSALREVGDQVARASESSAEHANAAAADGAAIKVAAPKANEGDQALEAAARDLELGDYERCRTRLYSLLSVADRFDVKQRSRLAARAQVMIADSYREQADRVERESAARGGESGFISVPGESQR